MVADVYAIGLKRIFIIVYALWLTFEYSTKNVLPVGEWRMCLLPDEYVFGFIVLRVQSVYAIGFKCSE